MSSLAAVVIALAIVSVDRFGEALRLEQVYVPSEVVVGQSATLQCRYDLEGEMLYSVKWYKNGREFFRIVPNDTPPSQIFPVEGIRVNLTVSDRMQVTLQDINLLNTGRYKCEVSAEAPNFQTRQATGEMKVIVLPREPPKITGAKATYQVGDELKANCTSLRSKPAAALVWNINGGQVNPIQENAVIPYKVIIDSDGMETAVLGLRFRVTGRHFRNGKMHLTCTASISKIRHNASTSQNISNSDGDSPKQRPLESRPSASKSGSSTSPKQWHRIFSPLLLTFLLMSVGPLLFDRSNG